MAQMELPLPELIVEDFRRGWTRFEFVAAAKDWNANKQLAVIPTLLRGRLIDYYVELDDDTKGDLKLLKAALQERTGTKEDPLLASRNFNQRNQGPDEKMHDFASALKQLFKNAYSTEAMTSTVLLQRFLTGLRPDIGRQLLLKKKSADFSAALKDAVDIEYALEFDNSGDSINALTRNPRIISGSESSDAITLCQSLETLTKRLDSLETTLQRTQKSQAIPTAPRRQRGYRYANQPNQPRFRDTSVGPCYNCGQVGHLRRNCPLNSYGPAPRVDDSWPHH